MSCLYRLQRSLNTLQLLWRKHHYLTYSRSILFYLMTVLLHIAVGSESIIINPWLFPQLSDTFQIWTYSVTYSSQSSAGLQQFSNYTVLCYDHIFLFCQDQHFEMLYSPHIDLYWAKLRDPESLIRIRPINPVIL